MSKSVVYCLRTRPESVLLDFEPAWVPLAVLTAALGAAAGVQYAVNAWKLARAP